MTQRGQNQKSLAGEGETLIMLINYLSCIFHTRNTDFENLGFVADLPKNSFS